MRPTISPVTTMRTSLPKRDNSVGHTAEEARRDIPGRRAASAQVDDIRDDPTAERDLGTDVDEDEQRDEVDVAQAHDLLVLAAA